LVFATLAADFPLLTALFLLPVFDAARAMLGSIG
jgi:hypothetical protein